MAKLSGISLPLEITLQEPPTAYSDRDYEEPAVAPSVATPQTFEELAKMLQVGARWLGNGPDFEGWAEHEGGGEALLLQVWNEAYGVSLDELNVKAKSMFGENVSAEFLNARAARPVVKGMPDIHHWTPQTWTRWQGFQAEAEGIRLEIPVLMAQLAYEGPYAQAMAQNLATEEAGGIEL